MEIVTLLKADIRHKKGAFICLTLLMIIISMSMTAILSVQDNCRRSHDAALESADAGNLLIGCSKRRLTDELLNSVKNHSLVEKVQKYSAVIGIKEEAGGITNNNSWYLEKLRSGYKLYNSDLTAYEDTVPALERGEIYITQGIMTSMNCSVGETIKIYTIGKGYEFKIKGIFVEPVLGASVIGWKQVFISDEDFEQMYVDAREKETEKNSADAYILQVHKAADCTLTDGQFRRQLNLDTGIVDKAASGSLTKAMSVHYTNLFVDIIFAVLMVFIAFLFVVMIIAMGHSISTEIEMDYVNLGVLKSQGFSKGKIRIVWMMKYLIVQIIGTVFGVIFAIPLIRTLGNVFQPITGVLADTNISLAKSLLLLFVLLLASGLFVCILTRKISKISPVRAISGGRDEIYFDSRMKAPVSQRGLLASLAFRQFTSSKRRYAGTVVIVSILVFFMLTITLLGNAMDSKSATEAMSGMYSECDVAFNDKAEDDTLKAIEKVIEKYSPIAKKYYTTNYYFSINGEETMCQVYKNPEAIVALKGRAPRYDNEIVVTEIIADELGLNMGDEVIVSHNESKVEYVISGIFQSINDTGMTFAMPLTGAEKLGVNAVHYAGYNLERPEECKKIVDELNAEFGDILTAKDADVDTTDDLYTVAIHAMKAVIYTFSILFALIVVAMVCSKIFVQERSDIGIYKAVGFTSAHLRIQFAVRFVIVALLGSAVGMLLSLLLSSRLLIAILRYIGITSMVLEFNTITILVPVVLICGCFFVFAYAVSRKVKRVAVRDLCAN